MTDVVERLNDQLAQPQAVWLSNLLGDSLDEITRLRALLRALTRERDEWRACANAERDELLALLRECRPWVLGGMEHWTPGSLPKTLTCEDDDYGGLLARIDVRLPNR